MNRSHLWIRTLAAVALAAICQIASAATPPVVISSDTKWSELDPTPDNTTVVITSGATLTVDIPNAACRGITVGSALGAGTLKVSASAQVVVAGSVTVGATVNSGTIDMTLGGVLELQRFDVGTPATAALVPGIGTVRFTSIPNFTLPSAFGSYHNLEFTGAATATLPPANVDIDGTLSLTAGKLDNPANMLRMVSASAIVRSKGALLTSAPQILGTVDLTYQQSGTLTTGLELPTSPTALRNLTIQNNSASLITIPPGNNITVNGNMTMSAGNFSIGGSTLAVRGNFTNSDSSPAFDPGSGTVTFDGSAHQVIGGPIEITFNNLTFKNSAGVSVSQNVTVNGTLGLDTGLVSTVGNKVLTVGPNGGVVRGTGWIFGTEGKLFPVGTTAAFTYDVGEEFSYWPMTALNTTSTVAGTVAAKVTKGDHPGISVSGLDGARSVNRFWTLTKTTFVGNTDLQFDNTDRDGLGDPFKFQVHKLSGNWSGTTPATNDPAFTRISGISSFGDFVIGEQLPHHYTVIPASLTQTAGVPFNATIQEQDILNLVVTASNYGITMTSSTDHVQFPGFNLQNGQATISVQDDVAETVTITASHGVISGTSDPIVVGHAVAHQIVVTLPGQTFVPGLGNTGAQRNQFQGVPFNLVSLTVTDAFFNIIPTSGAKVLFYTRPGSNGSDASYTANVDFVNGVSTTVLKTTLNTIENNTSISVVDVPLTVQPIASDLFDVRANTPPVVTILGIPESAVNEGSTVSLSAHVDDPDDAATFTYLWTITDHNNPGAFSLSVTQSSVVFVPPDNSTYDVSLFVQNNHNGSDTANASFSALNVPPTVSFTTLHTKYPVARPLSASATASDVGTADTFSYAWAVTRDGAPYDPAANTTLPVFEFSPQLAGNYVITVTVTDDDGGVSNIASKSITAGGFLPIVQIIELGGQNAIEGTPVSFSSTVTDPSGEADSFAYTWSVTKSGAPFGSNGVSTSYIFTPDDNAQYVITLAVEDYLGVSTSSVVLPVGNANPVISINETPLHALEAAPLTFTATVSDPAGPNDTLTYRWFAYRFGIIFPPGVVSGSSISFTPLDDGFYYVDLVVTDEDGGRAETFVEFTIENVPPTPAITGAPANSPEGEQISLGSSVTDPAAALDPISYNWSVTRNGTSISPSPITTSATYRFTPADSGNYIVTLQASDDEGGVSTAAVAIRVDNVAPDPFIQDAPLFVDEGVPVTLTCVVDDPAFDVDQITYSWTVTKDGVAYGVVGKQDTYTFTPDDDGTYEVSLTVRDKDFGVGTDSVEIVVFNQPPVASAGSNQAVVEGQRVFLNGDFTDPGAADTHTFSWSVTTTNGEVVPGGTNRDFSFTPQDNGTYTVAFRVEDDDGDFATASVQITVANAPPAAQFTNSGPANEGDTVTVSFAGATDPSTRDVAAGFQYRFDFHNDGTFDLTSSTPSAQVPAELIDGGAEPRRIIVAAEISDKDGGKSAYTTEIVISNVAPIAAFTKGDPENEAFLGAVAVSGVADPSQADVLAGFTYSFDFNNNGTFNDLEEISNGAQATVNVPAQYRKTNPNHIVHARVTDQDGGSVEFRLQQPQFAGSVLSATATANLPFTYTLSATGLPANIVYTAVGSNPNSGVNSLEDIGLQFDGTKIAGTPTRVGQLTIQMTAQNAAGIARASLILTIGGEPNTVAPDIVSGPTATPGRSTVNVPIAFSAVGTDADGNMISYSWSFGDGNSSKEQNPPHAYAAAGNYTVVLTVSDGKNSSSKDIFVTITSGPDVPFEISKFTVAFNFKTPGKHALAMTGKATLPNNAIFAGTQFEFIATGSHYRRMFQIDAKGKWANSVMKFAVATKSTKYTTLPGPPADLSVRQFTLSDKSATLFDELSTLGFVNATTSANVVVPITLRINSRYLQASVTLKYKAVAGKSGSGKK